MNKKTLVSRGIFMLILIIACTLTFGIGYWYGRLSTTITVIVETYSAILFDSADAIMSLDRDDSIVELMKRLEDSGKHQAEIVRIWQPYVSQELREHATLSLEVWEKAQDKLREIRSIYNKDDISADSSDSPTDTDKSGYFGGMHPDI